MHYCQYHGIRMDINSHQLRLRVSSLVLYGSPLKGVTLAFCAISWRTALPECA